MAALQRADLSDRDEFGALAPDARATRERETSVMQPKSNRQRELLEEIENEHKKFIKFFDGEVHPIIEEDKINLRKLFLEEDDTADKSSIHLTPGEAAKCLDKVFLRTTAFYRKIIEIVESLNLDAENKKKCQEKINFFAREVKKEKKVYDLKKYQTIDPYKDQIHSEIAFLFAKKLAIEKVVEELENQNAPTAE